MKKIRTVGQSSRMISTLWVLLVSLLFAVPVLAQDGPEVAATPAAVTTPAVQASPSQEAPSISPTPQKKRAKTMGELILGEGGGPGATEIEPNEQGVSDQPESGTTGKFVLRDPKPASEHWATEGKVGKSTFFDQLIRVCWSLAIVSFLVWVAGKVAEKAGLKEIAVGTGARSMIEIIEKKRLSPGRTILLMRVGPKVLAVAATEKGYETLTEMDGEQFKNYQDSVSGASPPTGSEGQPTEGGMTPGDVLRHYLSIIPGTGAKK